MTCAQVSIFNYFNISCIARSSEQDVLEAKWFMGEPLSYSIQRLMSPQYWEIFNPSARLVLVSILRIIRLMVVLEQKGLDAMQKGSSEWLNLMCTCFRYTCFILDSCVTNLDQLSFLVDHQTDEISASSVPEVPLADHWREHIIENYVLLSQSMDSCHKVSNISVVVSQYI